MGDLVALQTRPEKVAASVIERLEEVLAEARAGHVESVAVAVVNTDGTTSSCWSMTDNFPSLLGAVARLAHKLNVNQDG